MAFHKREYRERIRRGQNELEDGEAILIRKSENVRYFTGVDSGRLLIWGSGEKFWLKEVYFKRAKDSPIKPIAPEKDGVKKAVEAHNFKRLWVDGMTLAEYKSMESSLRKIIKPSDICEKMREIKSKEEIKAIAKAGKMAARAMEQVFSLDLVGMREYDIAAEVEGRIRELGSERPPFSEGMICASGPNTAYPHVLVSGRRIKYGDLLMLDLGAVYDGYYSDMTRTIAIGRVRGEKRKIMEIVESLKWEAIDRVEAGGSISEIHKYVEGEIERRGYKFFHLLGHGVGLEIHERPSIGPEGEEVFEEGMVFTIEPGIYTRRFGARDEDTIVLSKGKKRILTRFF